MKYHATVTNYNDPSKLGRIKVKCQQIVGSEQELPMWIPPDVGYFDKSGACFWGIPSVDTVVELIEIEDDVSGKMGEFKEAYLDNAQYRYRPTQFTNTTQPSDVWKANYGKRFGFNSPAGHYIIFDDEDETITLVHKSGNSSILFDKDGKVKIKGAEIWIDESASKHLVRGEPLQTMLGNWYTFLTTHTQTAVMPGPGISGVPSPPPPSSVPADLLSTKHKVE